MNYEKSKKQAFSKEDSVREALASRVDIVPEILYLLAKDKVDSVRLAVAKNNATPHPANRLLAGDKVEKIRYWVARKIAILAPTFSREEKNRTWEIVHELLNSFIRDAEVSVRFAVSDSLKSVKKAPPDVIRHLAHDDEIQVSGPVLENSPVLTDEDLIEIVETSPGSEALSAISKRKEVKEDVTEAIIATDDRDAIANLLFNSGAEIKEETMGVLIERSEEVDMWQEPLVKRTDLSDDNVPKLANVVSDDLLVEMYQRDDFSSKASKKISKITKKRAKEQGKKVEEFIADNPAKEKPVKKTDAGETTLSSSDAVKQMFEESDIEQGEEDTEVIEKVCQLEEAGILNEEAITEAIGMHRRFFVTAAFVVKTGLSPENVAKVLESQNAKMLVALSAKAGLTAQFAVELQKTVGEIDSIDLIEPDPETKDYSMTPKQLEVALTLFCS